MTTYNEKVKQLLKSAIKNHEIADAKEAGANARKAKIRKDELHKLYADARKGNEIAKQTVAQCESGYTGSFDVQVDTRASNDALWKAEVANNQFYHRKADADTGLVTAILTALERGIIKGEDHITDSTANRLS